MDIKNHYNYDIFILLDPLVSHIDGQAPLRADTASLAFRLQTKKHRQGAGAFAGLPKMCMGTTLVDNYLIVIECYTFTMLLSISIVIIVS